MHADEFNQAKGSKKGWLHLFLLLFFGFFVNAAKTVHTEKYPHLRSLSKSCYFYKNGFRKDKVNSCCQTFFFFNFFFNKHFSLSHGTNSFCCTISWKRQLLLKTGTKKGFREAIKISQKIGWSSRAGKTSSREWRRAIQAEGTEVFKGTELVQVTLKREVS